ncbi:OPT family oligopeptide transporter [Novosphingobium nitrogenifigens DSM 19370]|uniref:OPT family oligopeptide transporter n=1 Tax=Novosphingobium nitrogenifigens DSM 19370 TaxID=983920 RepID=F1ZD44_9SPHN|nr:OPT family oligopeptide transporter [Novosphingobium nitrogenifigens DSM 19370]
MRPPVELSLRGIVLGCLITVLFTAANIYLCLQSGLTFASSIPAAVISMAVLKVFRDSGILENNIVQTVASSAGTLSCMVFVLPGFVMIGYWHDFPFWPSFWICAAGGILGVVYSVPLRRSLVTGSDLPYPEGVAAAEVLRAGEGTRGNENADAGDAAEARLGLKAVITGSISSAVMALLVGTRLLASEIAGYARFGSAATGMTVNMQLALFGAGHLVGLTGGLAMLVGLGLAWGVAVPVMTMTHPAAGPAVDLAMDLWRHKVRFVFASALAVTSVWTLLRLARPVFQGILSAVAAQARRKAGEVLPLVEQDMPMSWLGGIVLVLLVPVALLLHGFLAGGPLAPLEVPLMIAGIAFVAITGFLVAAVCGYMAGLIGSSNSPLSSLAILGVIGSAGLLSIVVEPHLGPEARPSLVALSLLVAGLVLGVATIANDNLQDLKTGQLVGATPWRQQVALVVGVIAGAVVIPPIMSMLGHAYGFAGVPGAGPKALAAPQAVLITTLAGQFIGGTVEWSLLGAGALIGVGLIVLDAVLERRGGMRLPPLAIAFAGYIPPGTISIVIIGALAGHFYEHLADRNAASPRQADVIRRLGVILASGLIVGESLVNVVLAGLVAAAKGGLLNVPDTDWPLAVVGAGFAPWSEGLAIIVIFGTVLRLYRWAARLGAGTRA